ncbi:DUF3768 domain-containing protein [Ruegeria sp. HKCCD8929]|uniref:DUF3768 domain-containing protein n=1 Tax=Ruegeria sp. HKCCD8929 TaxID=2683006 RepID=UPI0020C37E8E|nr:DUF3768 domain-containing protein [Ruegeria sp. HKCCD8929]
MPNLMDMTPEQIARQLEINAIAQQNDAFRKYPHADESIGRWVITRAVNEKGPGFVLACIAAVRAYEAFTEDADPYGERAMGSFEIEGETVWFKIDLYDAAYEYGSPAPADVTKTRRVLTILFPSDY